MSTALEKVLTLSKLPDPIKTMNTFNYNYFQKLLRTPKESKTRAKEILINLDGKKDLESLLKVFIKFAEDEEENNEQP